MFTIEPGDAITIRIEEVPPAWQMKAIRAAYEAAVPGLGHSGLRQIAAFRCLNGEEHGLVGKWERPADWSRPDAFAPGIEARHCYEVVTVDRLDGSAVSELGEDKNEFIFINVFQCVPEKREAMIDYFNYTIGTVRKQPGYIATNFVMSVDNLQAANIGIYETRETFLAIFRQPEVLWDFAKGWFKGMMPSRFGPIPEGPRLRLYELVKTDVGDRTT